MNGKQLRVRDKQKDQVDNNLDNVFCENVLHLKHEEWPVQSKRTGVVYDDKMKLHKCEWDPDYPENPRRLTEIYHHCEKLKLFDRCFRVEVNSEPNYDVLNLHHDSEYLQQLCNSESLNSAELKMLSSKYDGAYFNNHTWKATCTSLNGVISLTESVLKGELKNAYALVRPPGHHAMSAEACGYCYVNNVALAAKHALENLGAEKVLIVDWDVHHGQATQYAFYDDPRVLYFSIHRYENHTFWPCLRESDFDFIGEGSGVGYNVNVPLNETGMNNADYLAVFQNLLLPVAYEFDPDLVLVSAGYDAAIGCPEGMMNLHPACFSHMMHSLMGLAEGKIVASLEGGYCLASLSAGVAATLSTLLGDPCPTLEPLDELKDSLVDSVLQCITALRPYWKCLALQGISEKVLRPDLSSLSLQSWSQVKEIVFPDIYPKRDSSWTSEKLSHLKKVQEKSDNFRRSEGTCVVYDCAMKEHKTQGHPERPSRIAAIQERLVTSGLWRKCAEIPTRSATKQELLMIHERAYIKRVKLTANLSKESLREEETRYNSIYLNNKSYECALLSAGSLLNLTEEICTGNMRNGFAVIRPPGHHAEQHSAMGFCFFNNVALAARYALTKFPHLVKRVLIFDWDVHHGNGVQHMFYSDPSVLYMSLHRHDEGRFYPSGPDGNYVMTGHGAGLGSNVNIPWNERPIGDTEYMTAFHTVVMPVARRFSPDLVLVSAGFDAARGDCLGGLDVTPQCFSQMTHFLSSLAQGRVLLALEGGYSLRSIADSAAYCVAVLKGYSPLRMDVLGPPCHSAVQSIRDVIITQRELLYGADLRFQHELPWWRAEDDVEEVECQEYGAVGGQHGGFTELLIDFNGMSLEDAELIKCLQGSLSGFVSPKNTCPHLEAAASVGKVPDSGLDVKAGCGQCGDSTECWFCMCCYERLCGRYVNGHMLAHHKEASHPLVLSCADLSVWCYECEVYLDNEKLREAKNAAHISKFGEPMP